MCSPPVIAPAVSRPGHRALAPCFQLPKSLDTIFGSARNVCEKQVRALSGGKFEVSVHAAGELMPDLRRGGRCRQHDRGWRRPPRTTTPAELHLRLWLRRAVRPGPARQMDAMDGPWQWPQVDVDAFYASYNIKSRSAWQHRSKWVAGTIKRNQDRLADLKGPEVPTWVVACSAKPCKSWVWCRKTCLRAAFAKPWKGARWTPLSSSVL